MTDAQKWQLLALTVLLGALLYWLAPVLTPFALSALFAYLGDPVVDRLQRLRMSRGSAVLVVFSAMTLGMVALVIGVLPLLERQIAYAIEKLPQVVDWTNRVVLPWIQQRFGVTADALDPQQLIDMLRNNWKEAGGFAAGVLASVSKSGFAVIAWLANVVLIPVVTFYLLRDWDALRERVRELLPRTVEPVVSRLAAESDQVLAAFLRGQLSVMVALGLIYSLGLMAVGLDLAFLIGMLAGLVSFVPYLGLILGGAAAVIAAAVQFQDWLHPALVLAVFAAGQLIEGFVLTPTLVGDKVGLHPVAVIFAIMAGGQLFGFLGILLALPAAAVLMVILRHAHERYLASGLYGAGAGGNPVGAALAATDSPATPAPVAASAAPTTPSPQVAGDVAATAPSRPQS